MVKQLFPVTFDRDGDSRNMVKDFTPTLFKNNTVVNDEAPILKPEASTPVEPAQKTKRVAKP